ncbi:YqeG family HAD IIIA-type phosphatase [Metallumcola ferriviriculae]|uniref:YqeG family HAD IIIA-type phosphatase n=1 Tax=Metallumcola ferriviriculae TaxID=3039180 RepID=A0AAU0US87_9FIRM|nr:YqeG family HAD IIIA-type phosphatase [Desulfitibacteraceae bacterium MK1]
MNILRPDLYVDSLHDIPMGRLHNKGIRGFVLDLDNTITEWNNKEVTPEVIEWFKKADAKGFKLCIASNNNEDRVARVGRMLGVPFLSKAAKPRRRAYRKALSLLELDQKELAVVGDQVFTDVLGGNRAGLYTILVAPISSVEFFGTRIMRRVERLVLPFLSKNEVK